jgi:hypothetical protein
LGDTVNAISQFLHLPALCARQFHFDTSANPAAIGTPDRLGLGVQKHGRLKMLLHLAIPHARLATTTAVSNARPNFETSRKAWRFGADSV